MRIFKKPIFKKVGSIAKGVAKGLLIDAIPMPKLGRKEVEKKKAADLVRSKVESNVLLSNENDIFIYVADLLDDGKVNQSVDEKSIEHTARLISGLSGSLAVLYYIITEILI